MTTLHDIVDNFDKVSKLYDVYLTHGLNPGRDRPGVPYLHEPRILSLDNSSHFTFDPVSTNNLDCFVVDVQVDKSGIDKRAYEVLGDGYLGGHLIDKDDDMNCEVTLKYKNTIVTVNDLEALKVAGLADKVTITKEVK